MTLMELAINIGNNNIPNYLVFFGDEQKIIDLYIDTICENYKKIYVDTVVSCVTKLGKKSLDKSKKAYIISNDESYLKADNAWKSVEEYAKRSNSVVIIRYQKLSKKEKFYKNNNCIEFTKLSEDVLTNYILRDLPDLSEKNTNKLIGYCDNDYGRILMEIDKIKQYKEYISHLVNGISVDDCFEELDKQELFHKEIGDITFELTNAVLGGYTDKAIQKLDEAKRKGEPAMMIASILYNGFRNLLAYQGLGKNKNGAMERTGMTKGELWGCTKNIGGYNIEELKRNMLFCQRVESGIKMGTLDEDIALDYVVLTCLH